METGVASMFISHEGRSPQIASRLCLSWCSTCSEEKERRDAGASCRPPPDDAAPVDALPVAHLEGFAPQEAEDLRKGARCGPDAIYMRNEPMLPL